MAYTNQKQDFAVAMTTLANDFNALILNNFLPLNDIELVVTNVYLVLAASFNNVLSFISFFIY